MHNFGFPYEIDRLIMRQAYPWLESYVQPGCLPEPNDNSEGDPRPSVS